MSAPPPMPPELCGLRHPNGEACVLVKGHDGKHRHKAAHTCHVGYCAVKVPPAMLMCRRHWFSVPQALQRAVWAEYRKGLREGTHPTYAWHAAADDALAAAVKAERGESDPLVKWYADAAARWRARTAGAT